MMSSPSMILMASRISLTLNEIFISPSPPFLSTGISSLNSPILAALALIRIVFLLKVSLTTFPASAAIMAARSEAVIRWRFGRVKLCSVVVGITWL